MELFHLTYNWYGHFVSSVPFYTPPMQLWKFEALDNRPLDSVAPPVYPCTHLLSEPGVNNIEILPIDTYRYTI